MSYVVGTAGHVDHGKSTLIRALTGIDPDRLQEEKRRGMTIDLGFAYVTLPSGRLAGIVDVPGHSRFIHNMLAGVHGLDAVLLVVAADEGVMPQTIEHLDILGLLQITRGVVALTKIDLVEQDWQDLVTADLEEKLSQTGFAGARIVPVSAVSGRGLENLLAEMDRLLDLVPPRADGGRPRLPIDRVFTISGFGTVVTGTLVDGSIRVGDELEALPARRRVRVRGLEQHGKRVEVALPGSRVAANLIGADRDHLRRGDVLARPRDLLTSRRLDAEVRVLEHSPQPLRHGSRVQLHTGTAEVPARLVLLSGDQIEPGGRGWAQLHLGSPVAAAAGDRFVLRLPSPSGTVGGGVLVDISPHRHHRRDASVALSLERRLAGGGLAEELRKYPSGVTPEELARIARAEPAEVAALEGRRVGRRVFSAEAWLALAERCRAGLDSYHRLHPLRPGMPREELKSRLGLPAGAFTEVVRALVADSALAERDGVLALPGHAVSMESWEGQAGQLREILGRQPYSPPSLADAMRQAGAGSEVVRALVDRGEVVVLSDEVAMTRAAYEAAVAAVRELIGTHGSVTVAQLRDRLDSTRRPMLALLEHLDGRRVTRRVGDARVLR